jgi:hypothetical protein
MQVRHLKGLYALASLLWTAGLSVWLLASHVTDRSPITSGTLFCLLLFVSVPAIGYVLLFTLFPRAIRFLRR